MKYKVSYKDPTMVIAMALDAHFIHFTKISGKSLDFYFLVGTHLNTLRQNGRYFADDIFISIFLNENVWISLKISLQFVHQVRIGSISLVVNVMAWHRTGDEPLSESRMASLWTHICVTRSQWVNSSKLSDVYMCQYTKQSLVPIMSCRLIGASHSLSQCWHIVHWIPADNFQWNSNQYKKQSMYFHGSKIRLEYGP